MPPPVRFGSKALAILLERPIVVQLRPRRFGIEVIIELDAVYRIALYDLCHDAGDPVAHFRDPRVENETVSGGTDPLRMQDIDAGGKLRKGTVKLGDGFGASIDRDAIGVEPCMNAHAALMGFIQHKL